MVFLFCFLKKKGISVCKFVIGFWNIVFNLCVVNIIFFLFIKFVLEYMFN